MKYKLTIEKTKKKRFLRNQNLIKLFKMKKSAKRYLGLMKEIDKFSKLTLPDLTISSQNMHKEWGCQAPSNMTLKLSSDLNLSKR